MREDKRAEMRTDVGSGVQYKRSHGERGHSTQVGEIKCTPLRSSEGTRGEQGFHSQRVTWWIEGEDTADPKKTSCEMLTDKQRRDDLKGRRKQGDGIALVTRKKIRKTWCRAMARRGGVNKRMVQ